MKGRKYSIYCGGGRTKHYCERTPMIITAVVCIIVLIIVGAASCTPMTTDSMDTATTTDKVDYSRETIGERMKRLNDQWARSVLK